MGVRHTARILQRDGANIYEARASRRRQTAVDLRRGYLSPAACKAAADGGCSNGMAFWGWKPLNHLRGIETATLASLDPHLTWRLFVAMR